MKLPHVTRMKQQAAKAARTIRPPRPEPPVDHVARLKRRVARWLRAGSPGLVKRPAPSDVGTVANIANMKARL